MNDERRRVIPTELLAAYAEGEVTPSEAETVEAELADSAGARQRLAGLQRVRDALAGPVPDLETLDLVAPLRRAIETGAPRRRRRPILAWGLAASACVAGAVAVVSLRRAGDEFRSKSATSQGHEGERWAGIQAYSLAPAGEPRPLAGRLSVGAGLLFSYTNLGPQPFEFLMIFTVDARGEVRWCHPAYERADANPASIRIQKGRAQVPLGELIHLGLPPGPATIHALFTTRPLRVLEVEAWLGEHRSRGSPAPWVNASHQAFDIEVEP